MTMTTTTMSPYICFPLASHGVVREKGIKIENLHNSPRYKDCAQFDEAFRLFFLFEVWQEEEET